MVKLIVQCVLVAIGMLSTAVGLDLPDSPGI